MMFIVYLRTIISGVSRSLIKQPLGMSIIGAYENVYGVSDNYMCFVLIVA